MGLSSHIGDGIDWCHMRRCKPARFTEIKAISEFPRMRSNWLWAAAAWTSVLTAKLQYESRANTCSLDSSASTRIICKHRLVWFTGLATSSGGCVSTGSLVVADRVLDEPLELGD